MESVRKTYTFKGGDVVKAVIICGDRAWNNAEPIHRELSKLPKTCLIIQGGAPGADTYAKLLSEMMGFETKTFAAEWAKYGRAAGPVRNKEMLKALLTYAPEIKVLAFHKDVEQSKGTKNMITQARKADVMVELFTD